MLELQLDEDQEVVGAGVSTYGLEASRVTQPHRDERNFHVFHYLAEVTLTPTPTPTLTLTLTLVLTRPSSLLPLLGMSSYKL